MATVRVAYMVVNAVILHPQAEEIEQKTNYDTAATCGDMSATFLTHSHKISNLALCTNEKFHNVFTCETNSPPPS